MKFRKNTLDERIYRSVVEGNEYCLPDRFEETDVVIDCGLHIGCFSYACIRRGAKKIIAFEPMVETIYFAKRNLRKYYKIIQFNTKAIWYKNCNITLFIDQCLTNSAGNTVIYGGGQRDIEAVSLDSVLERFEKIKFLKMDIEGAEFPVLMRSELLSKIQTLAVEFHIIDNKRNLADLDFSKEDVDKKLKNIGFKEKKKEYKNPELIFFSELVGVEIYENTLPSVS